MKPKVIEKRVYEVRWSGGAAKAQYNPRATGQNWISLGVYHFNKNASVTLKADSNEIYRADSVAFVPVAMRSE